MDHTRLGISDENIVQVTGGENVPAINRYSSRLCEPGVRSFGSLWRRSCARSWRASDRRLGSERVNGCGCAEDPNDLLGHWDERIAACIASFEDRHSQRSPKIGDKPPA